MRKILTVAVVMAALVPVAACGKDDKPTGTVVSKEHDQAERKCSKYKKSGSQRRCVKWKTEPEEWELTIRTANGKEVEVDVDRDAYDRYHEGDHYPG